MRPWSRTILRLSGRGQKSTPTLPAPERKSEAREAAAVFRRFFQALALFRRELPTDGDARKGGGMHEGR